ncbi:nucleoside hydrolase [Fontisphaera persica]|uniref:nucleoside hydrolase n=1 Tax=Fontisphaera persica TaxID=2974023 RepID=UPI0024BF37D8|nr:nucleoside hydrolase [Fontisphaera persica]WCJ60028.1 nucleoside hydrolase [Fontisphaera persica]
MKNMLTSLAVLALMGGVCCFAPLAEAAQKRIPVILDTDIGDDIDDTWALGMILLSPEVDLKLVVTDYGKVNYRPLIVAKFLQAVGRTDIPIGIGVDEKAHGSGPQASWIKGYNLQQYPGKVYSDGVQAMIDMVMSSPEPITLLCIGPLPNIAEALKREPRIAQKARFVGMHGSLRVGYGGNKQKVDAEWNVRADVKACQAAFAAPWEMTITPLDTCGLIVLQGERYAKVRNSQHPVAKAIIENYRAWEADRSKGDTKAVESRSSTLFDCVAVYLVFAQDLCKMERLGVKITEDGFTRIDPEGKMVNAATEWKDQGAFEDLLVQRVTGGK